MYSKRFRVEMTRKKRKFQRKYAPGDVPPGTTITPVKYPVSESRWQRCFGVEMARMFRVEMARESRKFRRKC